MSYEPDGMLIAEIIHTIDDLLEDTTTLAFREQDKERSARVLEEHEEVAMNAEIAVMDAEIAAMNAYAGIADNVSFTSAPASSRRCSIGGTDLLQLHGTSSTTSSSGLVFLRPTTSSASSTCTKTNNHVEDVAEASSLSRCTSTSTSGALLDSVLDAVDGVLLSLSSTAFSGALDFRPEAPQFSLSSSAPSSCA
ncbi:unnamed protein product, partial [Amoebophrya sp. A25]|eukprot:GSA25T00006390001.1